MEHVKFFMSMLFIVVSCALILAVTINLLVRFAKVLAIPAHLIMLYLEFLLPERINYRIPATGTKQRNIADIGAALITVLSICTARFIFKYSSHDDILIAVNSQPLIEIISGSILFFVGFTIIIWCSINEPKNTKTIYQKLDEINFLDVLFQFK